MTNKIQNINYKDWVLDFKSKIQNRQIKAALSVNSELIMMYWDLGKEIAEKQETAKWGSGLINQLSKDLKVEFPGVGGFSAYNLRLCVRFYKFYTVDFSIWEQVVPILKNDGNSFIKKTEKGRKLNNQELINYFWEEVVPKIPWGHHILILKQNFSLTQSIFYINKTIENNWSRAVLQNQIESKLYERQGKSISNFKTTLPKAQSDLANELLKDPYNFDFLQITEKHNELELENALIDKITKLLLELGTGFSFVGKQYNLKLESKDYYLDLLFYHLKLRCFVVIELKVVAFQPEYVGKLNFYLNLVDDQLKHENDNPTIGIVICKTKNNIEAEYALRGIEKPIGISEYELNKILQEEFKGSLPTIEEIEYKLKN